MCLASVWFVTQSYYTRKLESLVVREKIQIDTHLHRYGRRTSKACDLERSSAAFSPQAEWAARRPVSREADRPDTHQSKTLPEGEGLPYPAGAGNFISLVAMIFPQPS